MASTDAKQTFTWQGLEARRLPELPQWIEPLGRAGYAAKGIVYGVIGILAFKLAIGSGGEAAGSRDAIEEIGKQAYGKAMLGVMAIGLIGYTIWRFVQCLKDTEGNGSDAGAVVKRAGYAVSGVAYLLLGCYAGSIALGLGFDNDGDSSLQSTLLSSLTGRLILGSAGLTTIGVACYLCWKGAGAKFLEKYKLSTMTETQRTIALYAGRTGLITRGIAFAMIGAFIAMSAYSGTSDGEIAGMGHALAAIAAQPYGKLLIGLTGLGLMGYAVHMLLMSFFRRFNING